ncbi:MAG: hypothetical protein AAF940_00125 [Pseudomonadota bacterium]
MLRKEITCKKGGPIILMDTITSVSPADAGAIVVSGSHGGASSAEFALQAPLKLVFFNDAGGGKDNAGIAALTLLQDRNIPCATVAHTSCRIGDAADMWENGIVSHVNSAAQKAGLYTGMDVRAAVSGQADLS